MTTEGQRLAQLARAIRESTLERLRRVPEGAENWRITPNALSFAELARHLVDVDHWLLAKLQDPDLPSIEPRPGEYGPVTRQGYAELLAELAHSCEMREQLLKRLTPAGWNRRLPDDRFGGEATVWWMIVRGNLDHEIHHRGQIATYLRVLEDRVPYPEIPSMVSTSPADSSKS